MAAITTVLTVCVVTLLLLRLLLLSLLLLLFLFSLERPFSFPYQLIEPTAATIFLAYTVARNDLLLFLLLRVVITVMAELLLILLF